MVIILVKKKPLFRFFFFLKLLLRHSSSQKKRGGKDNKIRKCCLISKIFSFWLQEECIKTLAVHSNYNIGRSP